MFKHLIGNERAAGYLSRMVERRMVGQSFLFAGPCGVGKSLFAQALAAQIIGDSDKLRHGNHPDLRIYRPEGKIGMHGIDSMREFHRDVYLAPLEAEHKVFIIHDADRMLSTSANALLKTFEEPADDSVIILLSCAPENLLPTVVSRCRRVYFQPIEDSLIIDWLVAHQGIDRGLAEKMTPYAGGSLGEAMRLCEHGDDEVRELALQALSETGDNYCDIQQVSSQIAASLNQLKEELEEEARGELMKIEAENMTATQRELLEKEIHGVASLNYQSEVDRLLRVVISWYRDLHLLEAGGAESLVVNRDYLQALKARKKRCCLDQVLELVSKTRLAIQRFAPVDSSFETLFLQLSTIQ